MQNMPSNRPTWDEYFMQICTVIGARGTCDRGQSGCVITRDKRIVATGYVGAPSGLPHCDEVGHLIKKVYNPDGTHSQHCIRTVHAEQNAICQAARLGVSLEDTTLYCKMEPCSVCSQLIINCGIKRVVCEKRYHKAQLTRKFFAQAGVSLTVLKDELQTYENM